MTTSGSYDNVSTMSEIISNAFSLINVIDDSEPLPADMFIYGKRQLNKLMSFISMHRGLWLTEDYTITLTPGTTNYTAGIGLTIDIPKPMSIWKARRVMADGNELPMDILSRSDYMDIPNKTLQAVPMLAYYDKKRDNGVLYVWPTGTTTNKTIIITTHRPIQDFDASGNNPDLPKEWILPIEFMLAEIISPKYLGGIIPDGIKAAAEGFLAALMNDDEETMAIIMNMVGSK